MNYLKLQRELLKAAYDRDSWRPKEFKYQYFDADTSLGIVIDGCVIVICPKKTVLF